MLYHINHPYYPKRNKGIDLFVVTIIIIITEIYDSLWCASSRSRLPATGRKYKLISQITISSDVIFCFIRTRTYIRFKNQIKKKKNLIVQ